MDAESIAGMASLQVSHVLFVRVNSVSGLYNQNDCGLLSLCRVLLSMHTCFFSPYDKGRGPRLAANLCAAP